MSCLAPCPACNRHVSSDETACPFCSAALPESSRCQTRTPRAPGRLSRAAMVAAGAALIGVEACGPTAVPVYGAPAPDATVDTGTMDGGPVALYGAAPPAFEQAPAQNSAPSPAKKKT